MKWRELSRKPDGFLTVCGKIVWLPFASLPDWIRGAYVLFIIFMLSRVEW